MTFTPQTETRTEIARWRSCYPDAWDGEETPHDLASEFFNRAAMVDSDGGIWLSGGEGDWADDDQKSRFLAWLTDNGHYVPI